MAGSFSQSIGKWASKTKARIDAVHARSVELLGEEMSRTKPEGGRVPFLVGDLSKSLLADKTGMPSISAGPFVGSNVGLVAATLTAEEPVWIGYRVNYARRVNYGFIGADKLGRIYNQQGQYFVEGAIAEWPNIVKQAVKDVKATAGGV